MVLQKLSQTFKVTIALMLSVLSTGILQTAPAYATPEPQVFVCKYVGKPGVNETLKSGKNPISINSNATVGTYFNDAQGRSYVLEIDNTSPGPNDDPNVSRCPTPDSGGNQITALPSGIADICGANNDTVPDQNTQTYTVTNDTDWVNGSRTITYTAAAGLVFSESEGWTVSADGKTATYTYTDWATACSLTPTVCEDPADGGVIDETSANWELLGDAEFVNGAVSINSSGWKDGGIIYSGSYSLADVQNLGWTVDTSGVTGAYGIGILLETATGEVIHYEPSPYTDDFWSDNAVLPMNGGGQGGPFSGSLQDLLNTIGNVEIVKTTFVFTSQDTNEGVLLTSLSFNCATYAFDKAPRVPTECTAPTYEDSFIQTWTYDGQEYPVAGAWPESGAEAEYEFTDEGLYLSTPDKESYTYGLFDAGMTPLLDIDVMSYDTFRHDTSTGNDSTLTAYILLIDLDGDVATKGDLKYLFYEPAYNGSVSVEIWQTWDTINGGEAKWWMSGTGQTLRTWDYYLETHPDAVALSYGFNQGTSNADTDVTIQDIVFDCATVNFASPGRGQEPQNPGTPETPGNDSGEVLGDSTGKTLATSTTVLPATIPATGATFNPMMIIIASLAAYGAAYFTQGRRRVTDI